MKKWSIEKNANCYRSSGNITVRNYIGISDDPKSLAIGCVSILLGVMFIFLVLNFHHGNFGEAMEKNWIFLIFGAGMALFGIFFIKWTFFSDIFRLKWSARHDPGKDKYIRDMERISKMAPDDIYHTACNEDSNVIARVNQSLANYASHIESNPYQEKKRDWAIAGGIAQGFAGAGAGVAAALDTMNENQKIEERNEIRREQAKQQAAYIRNSIQRSEKQEKEYWERKVIFSKNESEALDMLDVNNVRIEESVHNGEVIISITNVRSGACGLVKAILLDEHDNPIAESFVPLWFRHIKSNNVYASSVVENTGYCYPRLKRVAYKIRLEPVTMWITGRVKMQK